MSMIEAVDTELQELRDAVIAMATALGAALPMTPEVIALSVLTDYGDSGGTNGAR